MTRFPDLCKAAFHYPAIDHHCHPILTDENRDKYPLQAVISESSGLALEYATSTVAAYRAVNQLSDALDCEAKWKSIIEQHHGLDYDELCSKLIGYGRSRIHCMLIDDALGDARKLCLSIPEHDKFTKAKSRQILRIEVAAQDWLESRLKSSPTPVTLEEFDSNLSSLLLCSQAVAFKSIICYRTGLDISPVDKIEIAAKELQGVEREYRANKRPIRLASKALNDHVVHLALKIAENDVSRIPIQFHTGLGDRDIRLPSATPALMQPIIEAYPTVKFVLLHAGYPHTRDVAYLTAMYAHVYLDFGEVFPFVSAEGQRAVVRQMLELAPTRKILWSTDGHWWPESYYLGSLQAREILYQVLSEILERGEMSEPQAVEIVQNALFHNANRLYELDLKM